MSVNIEINSNEKKRSSFVHRSGWMSPLEMELINWMVLFTSVMWTSVEVDEPVNSLSSNEYHERESMKEEQEKKRRQNMMRRNEKKWRKEERKEKRILFFSFLFFFEKREKRDRKRIEKG